MTIAGMWRLSALGGALVAFTVASGLPAQSQELSEGSVKSLMNFAWSLVPDQFTPPNGETIKIDKSKKEEIQVPIDVAREVVRVGRLSAIAQVCDLKAAQVANHRSLMRREQAKKKWSKQQLVYINQLHLTTVMVMTGKIKVVGDDDDKDIVVSESTTKSQTCTAELRKKVDEMIVKYVKAGPKPPPVAAATDKKKQ